MSAKAEGDCESDIVNHMAALSNRLRRDEGGVWYVEGEQRVSYPEEVRSDYADVEPFSYWFNHRNRCIVSVMRRHVPRGTLIDIGGGNGYVALALKRAGLPVIVVEPGAVGAQIARSRGLSVIRSDFSAIMIANETIQAAGLFDVLEHVAHQFSFLDEIRNALAKDGLLFLTVPALPYLWSHEDNFVGHYRRYTIPTATHALTKTGFKVVFATYFFSPLVLPIFLLRSIPSLFGLIPNRERELQQSHALPSNVIGRWVKQSLAKEEAKIENGIHISTGSSILVVARKL